MDEGKSPTETLDAAVVPLPGQTVPDDFEEVLRPAGILCYRSSFDELPPTGSDEGGRLLFLWVGEKWEDGLEQLDSMMPTWRRLCVLVGPNPETAVGPLLRELGGLAYSPWPPPPWLSDALVDAGRRSVHYSPQELRLRLQSLRQRLAPTYVESFERILEDLCDQLGADRALVATISPGAEKPEPISWILPDREDLKSVTLRAGSIANKALQRTEIVIAPTTRHASIAEKPEHFGAVCIPLKLSGSRPDDHSNTAGLIFLEWNRPFLPTGDELLVLETAATVATPVLAQIESQRRISGIHLVASQALANAKTWTPEQILRKVSLDETGDHQQRLHSMARRFVEDLLTAYAACTDLRQIWAWMSPSSIAKSCWISTGTDARIPRQDITEAIVDLHGLRWMATADSTILLMPVRREIGALAAVFASRAAAHQSKWEIENLAEDLELGMVLLRRSADSAALVNLTKVFVGASKDDTVLERMTRIVRQDMDSSGAEVYVVSRSPIGPTLVLPDHRRDADLQKSDVREVPLAESGSLVRWVIEHDDWLLIPETIDASLIGEDPETGISGSHGDVKVYSQSEKKLFDSARKGTDNEGKMLLVPLRAQGKPAGAVSVWRAHDASPYDQELDSESLSHFAPHIASACTRLLHMEKTRQELREITRLDKLLSQARSLKEAYEGVAEGARKLTDAGVAILMHYDATSGDHGCLYPSAVTPSDERNGELLTHLQSLNLICGLDNQQWAKVVSSELEPILDRSPVNLQFRELIAVKRSLESPPLAVALLDAASSRGVTYFLADDWIRERCKSFLRYASTMLQTHVPAFASQIIEQITRQHDTLDSEAVLKEAAQLVQKATGADAAVVYSGASVADLVVTSIWPAKDAPLRFPIGRGRLTREAIENKSPRRVLKARSSKDLDLQALAKLAKKLGWQGVNSWLCCPVVHDERCLGLIKLLSKENGIFLGVDHERIASKVAERAAQEMYRMARQRMLDQLNQIGNDLARYEGNKLGRQMARRLATWASRFIMPKCTVVIYARTRDDRILVSSGYPERSPTFMNSLRSIEADRNEEEATKRTAANFRLSPVQQKLMDSPGIAVPFGLPGDNPLVGTLFFLHDETIPREGKEAALEAAREMSLILNMERLRRDWIRSVALFEHALIGPVQGISSAAKLLAEKAATESFSQGEVRLLKGRVEIETDFIRRWRESLRLQEGMEFKVKPREQELRPMVERCFDRYRASLEKRGVSTELKWTPRGPLVFPFDDGALDLALSNVLDNAAKYAFQNREVVVRVFSTQEDVHIAVEDIGHGIPEDRNKEIYEPGKRLNRPDPFRIIPGQGIGLTLAKAAIEAHGGTLTHISIPLGNEKSGAKQPHRVKFTLKLPTGWRFRK